MAYNIYWYSEKVKGLRNDDWCRIDTSINNTPILLRHNISPQVYTEELCAEVDKPIYMHDEAATEPVTDESVNTTDFTGETEDTYSTASTGYIKSWTSETGFFTSNQNFDDHNNEWVINYNNKYDGTPPVGQNLGITLEFYKRNAANSDTLLFSKDLSISIFKSVTGYSTTVHPTGSVLTTDRLRIRVLATTEVPS